MFAFIGRSLGIYVDQFVEFRILEHRKAYGHRGDLENVVEYVKRTVNRLPALIRADRHLVEALKMISICLLYTSDAADE